MEILLMLLIFILGLTVGSFLNVVIFRLESGEDMVNSRSKCMSCGHLLSWHDLFPVVSFLFLGGRCRYCKKKLSWQYPLVEVATGLLFVVLFVKLFCPGPLNILPSACAGTDSAFYGIIGFFLLIAVFSSLVVIFVYDLRHYIIPDQVIYPAIAAMFLFRIAGLFFSEGGLQLYALWEVLFPAFLASGFFLFLIIITKGEGMGGGDVKLGFLMGLVVGFPEIVLALFIAFISGAAVGVFLMFLRKKNMKSMLPFGPFLIFGLLVSYFWGEEIIEWYLNGVLL